MAQTKKKTATRTAKRATAGRAAQRKTTNKTARKQCDNREKMHVFLITAMAMVAGILLCADVAMIVA